MPSSHTDIQREIAMEPKSLGASIKRDQREASSVDNLCKWPIYLLVPGLDAVYGVLASEG